MDLDSFGNDSEFMLATDTSDTHIHALSLGERRLWLEVLRIALDDLAAAGRVVGDSEQSRARERSSLRQQALEWIHSEQNHIGSFNFICDLFNLDALAVRDRIKKMTPAELKESVRRFPTQNAGENRIRISTTMQQGGWGGPRSKTNGAKANAHGMNGNGHQANSHGMNGNGHGEIGADLIQLLPEKVERTKAGRPENNSLPAVTNYEKVLERLGLNRKRASWWQQEVRVPTMSNGKKDSDGNQSELGRLKELLGKFQAQLAQAEAEAVKQKAVVDNLRAAVEVLAGAQTGNSALTEGNTRAQVKTPTSRVRPNKPPPVAKQPGAALKRRHEALSITDAIRQILEASAEPIHHDQITRSVFQVSKNDFERAKASVTARLSQGGKKGLWRALGAGRYAAADGQGQSQGPGAAAPTGNTERSQA